MVRVIFVSFPRNNAKRALQRVRIGVRNESPESLSLLSVAHGVSVWLPRKFQLLQSLQRKRSFSRFSPLYRCL